MEQEIKAKRTRVVNTDQITTEEAAKEIAPTPAVTRTFSGNVSEKIHDLYKLLVATFKKNTAQANQLPNYQPAEHCHFFHTFTSDGVAQNTSSTIGGHFHVMEIVTPATDETPAVYKCSPPMKWAIVKGKYGQKEKKMVIANEDDLHTHDVKYLQSDKLTLRKKNLEAAAFHASHQAKYDKTLPGVQG